MMATLSRIRWIAASIALAPLLIAFFLIIILWAGTFHTIIVLENSKREEAQQDVINLARVFEEHVSRAVHETDKTLLFLRATYEASPPAFNLKRWVDDAQFKTELLVQFAFINSDGLMVESNVGPANQRIDLSDREHFKVHVNKATDELFISKPVLGRASGKWSIQLSRRVRDSSGNFSGVLVGSIDAEFLSHYYDGIDLGKDGATTLVGFDGVVRARAGVVSDVLGRTIQNSKVFTLSRSKGNGIYTEFDPIDQTQRLVGYRIVNALPLVVLVGISEEEISSRNSVNRNACIKVGATLTVLVILFIIAMYRKSRLDATVAVLAAERDRSDAANKAKSTFLAVMSHEIRTPMNAILGLSSTLLDKSLNQEDKKLVKLINEEGERLLVILNDILDYSKMESGKLSLETITFCPNDIASSVVKIAGSRGVAKGLIIESIEDPQLPAFLEGDAGRLRQVLLNLVSNAIKFTPNGKVTIETRCLQLRDGNAKIEWSVSDTGIGISPEHISNLFADFVQADSSISTCFGGSGLGLSISRRIVQQMGGDISIQSIPGCGTTVIFSVDLRVGTAQPEFATDLDISKRAVLSFIIKMGRKLKILIVDDSPTNRIVAAEMLQEFEATIDMACDGLEAVIAATQFRYDLILMDMRMPEMDGLQATKAIRSLSGERSGVPIIAFTANAYPEDVKACMEAGMVDFISKPVRKCALLDVIVRALNCDAVGDASINRPTTVATTGAVPLADAAEVFDPAMLNELVDALGVARTREAVGRFNSETESRLSALRNLTPETDIQRLAREAHSIKGISATFGLRELSDLAAELERNAANVSASELSFKVNQLEQSFFRAKNTLLNFEVLAA